MFLNLSYDLEDLYHLVHSRTFTHVISASGTYSLFMVPHDWLVKFQHMTVDISSSNAQFDYIEVVPWNTNVDTFRLTSMASWAGSLKKEFNEDAIGDYEKVSCVWLSSGDLVELFATDLGNPDGAITIDVYLYCKPVLNNWRSYDHTYDLKLPNIRKK